MGCTFVIKNSIWYMFTSVSWGLDRVLTSFCCAPVTGVRSSSWAAERRPNTNPGWGAEENAEWRDQTASSGEKRNAYLPTLMQPNGDTMINTHKMTDRLVNKSSLGCWVQWIVFFGCRELSIKTSWPDSVMKTNYGNRWGHLPRN